MSERYRNIEQLAASVLATLVRDIDAYNSWISADPETRPTSKSYVDRVKNSGIDALYCLYEQSEMVIHWCHLCRINITALREQIKYKYPSVCGAYAL